MLMPVASMTFFVVMKRISNSISGITSPVK
jgi:hypothetical protein